MTGPYPYPANIVIPTQLLVDKIITAKDTFTTPIADVWYGDQERILRTPTVCVEPNTKGRTLEGVPNMTRNEFEIFVLVYVNKVTDLQQNRKDADQLAYEIELLIHQDLQLRDATGAPTMIHGYVRENESGYTVKSGTLYRSARLTYFGLNKTSLPVN
jgi:hypothetical protein